MKIDAKFLSEDVATDQETGSSLDDSKAYTDSRIAQARIVRVRKNPQVGEYLTLALAIASITDASATNHYIIDVGAGIFEEQELVMKSFTHVIGAGKDLTNVHSLLSGAPLFRGAHNSSIQKIKISGVSNGLAVLHQTAGTFGDPYVNPGPVGPFLLHECLFTGNDTSVSTYGDIWYDTLSGLNQDIPCPTITIINNCYFGNGNFAYAIAASSVAPSYNRTVVCNFFADLTLSTSEYGVIGLAIGDATELVFNNLNVVGTATSLTKGLVASDGAHLKVFNALLKGLDYGVEVYAGVGTSRVTSVTANGLVIENSITKDISITDSTCTGAITGTFTASKVTVSTPNNINFSFIDLATKKHTFLGEIDLEVDTVEGPQGETGPQGPTGANGLSAYQVAVNNGFVGNEAAWLLSLQGADGEQGPQGEIGPQGPQGEVGPTGPSGATASVATTEANGLMSSTDKVKLDGVATGATANATDANLRDRATHTGTQAATTIVEDSTHRFLTDTERTKLSGVATGATANDTDANLKNRANHTGSQLASTISDFLNAVLTSVLTGLSLVTSSAITSTDTVLSALGKLQAQITGLASSKYDASNPSSYETTTQLNARDTANRSRANHTGTILSSVVSDFAATVRSTVLTGFSVGTAGTILAADTLLAALGKVQASINTNTNELLARKVGSLSTVSTNALISGNDYGEFFIDLKDVPGLVAGTYSLASVTVNQQGRVTAIAAGSSSSDTYNKTLGAADQGQTGITYFTLGQFTSVSLPVGVYMWRAVIGARSNATAAGVGFRVNAGTAVIDAARFFAKWAIAQAANGVAKDFVYDQVTPTTDVKSASALAANTDFVVTGEGVLTITTAGTIVVQTASEVAGNIVTAKRGSAFTISKVADYVP